MSEVPQRHASASSVISNGLSKLHREYYGRGPTSVRTIFGHDHVVTFLEEISTPLERTLIEAGESDAVVEVRRAFQRAMRERFIAVVESATQRSVRAFMSEVSLKPDMSVEVFVLDPVEADPNPAPEGVG
jgi:uncharacterized protein YbcI